MATANVKARCVTCGKEKATSKCGGCSQDFCYKHLGDHRQELSVELDEVEVMRDVFWQTVNDQKSDPEKHSIAQKIDKWERDSIKKIRQTAEEARQLFRQHISAHFTQMESKLNRLTDQLRQSRVEEDFFESDLSQWKKELTQLTEQLAKPSDITVHQDQTPLITKISVTVSSNRGLLDAGNIGANAKWTQNGITVAGGNGRGGRLNQLSDSYGMFVDDDQTIYIADTGNDRIVEWKSGATEGRVAAGGNGRGNRNDQLNRPIDVIVDKLGDCLIISDPRNERVVRWPRQIGARGQTIVSGVSCYGLAMDYEGYLYVSDTEKHEITRWRIGDTTGKVVAGGNDRGSRLNQFDDPCYIFVDQDRSIYVSDMENHRVIKWIEGAKEGVVVAGGQGKGDSLAQFCYPHGVAVDQSGAVYVADESNARIMRWSKESTQGSIIVRGNGDKNDANQIRVPTDLSMDQQGNLYVLDRGQSRVQRFNIDPSSIS